MAAITMPRLSDTMEEGTVSRWLKQVGDTVERGDVIAQIDTDKATMDLEAYESGVLEEITVQVGEAAPIGHVIGRLGTGAAPVAPAAAGASAGAAPPRTPESEPNAVRPASPSGSSQPVPAAVATEDEGGPVRASPVARAMARELGIELDGMRGSGPRGRVVRADIEAAAQAGTSTPSAAPTPPAAAAPLPADDDVEEIPLTNVRRVAARRLVESMQSTPHFYLTRNVDAEALTALRSDLNRIIAAAGEEVKVSVTDMLVKACAAAIRAVPELNVSWGGDRLRRHRRINIGIAVATDAGLVVPVVHDVDQKHLRQIALETKALIAKARAGKLALAEFSGGTFTISNLGMFGVEQFTAVINPPEAALLTVGATVPRVVAREGAAVVRRTFTVTLAIDHRALDGAAGARFLEQLVALLEDPLRIIA